MYKLLLQLYKKWQLKKLNALAALCFIFCIYLVLNIKKYARLLIKCF